MLIGNTLTDRADWRFDDPHFLGWQVDYATRDPRSGRIWVGASHMQWGPHLHYSDDEGATWQEAVSPSFGGLTTQTHHWDDGASWNICNALWNHPTRDAWTPGLAGLILHHIQVDPRDAQHLYIGISAAGIFETRDAGVTWTPRNRGVAGEHLPLGGKEEVGHCAHSFSLHPARPDRLYRRNHFGVYRSDDGGDTWVDIGDGLPGEFGFASTMDPNDADTFYTVPLQFDQARVPPGGALRVYRTRDAGNTWQPLGDGLPSARVLQGVYRQALCNDGAPTAAARPVGERLHADQQQRHDGKKNSDDGADQLGLYMGTNGGHLYASRDGGDTWRELLDYLAPADAPPAAARLHGGHQHKGTAAINERTQANREAAIDD